MITSILINALGQALFESCGQALIIYIVLQLLMHLFPGINSKYRYNINYLALTVICGWFFVNLVKIYTNAIAVPDYKLFIYGNVVSGNVHLPTLLQQAEAYIAKYSEYIAGLYFIGLMLHAFRLAGGLVHINYIRKPENLSKDCLLSQKTRLLGKALKISKTVSLYFSEHVQIPLTIGHLKPIIIFPLGLILTMTRWKPFYCTNWHILNAMITCLTCCNA
jgi:bla regulator protein BlaR1